MSLVNFILYLFLAIAIVGFAIVAFVVLFSWKTKIARTHDVILNLMFISASLSNFLGYADLEGSVNGGFFKYLLGLYIPFSYIYLPFIFLYIKKISDSKYNFSIYKYFVNFIPFLMLLFFVVVFFRKNNFFANNDLSVNNTYPYIYFGIFLFLNSIFWFYYIVIFKFCKKNNNINRITKICLLNIKANMIISIVISTFCFLNTDDNILYNKIVVQLGNTLSLIFLISTFIKKHSSFEEEYAHHPVLQLDSNSLIISKYKSTADKINEYVLNEKPFLNSELRLVDIAAKLEMSDELLSFVINHFFHQSFTDFINSYRIDYFIECCKRGDLEKYTIAAISKNCGFNSIVTFNRAFKRKFNMTPSEYIQANP